MTAPLHLDHLPVEWAAHKIDEYTFASQYGPLVSDTDDDSDHPDPDDSDDDDEQGSARQDRQASSPVDNHYQSRGRDAGPADALDEEKVKRTMRKRRKQLDEINCQRLCITATAFTQAMTPSTFSARSSLLLPLGSGSTPSCAMPRIAWKGHRGETFEVTTRVS